MKHRTVALLVPRLTGGGAERAALNLAGALERFQPLLVAEWAGGELEAEAAATHDVLSVSRAGRRPPRPLRIARLAHALRRSRPDAVVSFLAPLVATEASRLAGVPVVHWIQSPMSRVTPFTGSGVRPALNRRVLGHVARHSAAVAGASPGTLDELRPVIGRRTLTAVVPNPVRLPEPAPAGGSPGKRVVSIARLSGEKRHDVLLEGFARGVRDPDVRLLLFGNGPLLGELQQHAARLGLLDRVDFAGFVDAPADRLSREDVFAHCSDFEGFGNVFVEALSRGVRVVAADAPYGARFVLGGLRAATLVPPGDPDAVATALSTALAAGALAETDRTEARARAEEFSVERVAETMEALLDEVL